MGVFDESDSTILAKAFSKALSDYGVAKGSDISKIDNQIKIEPSDELKTEDSTISSDLDKLNEAQKQQEISGNSLASKINVLEESLKLAGRGADIYNESLKTIAGEFQPFLSQMNSLQEAYGGISINPDEMLGSAKAASDRLQNMQDFFYTQSGKQMGEALGFQGNALSKYFKDEKEAFNIAENIISRLTDQHSQFVNKMDDQTLYKLPMYTKSLGISTSEVATLIERSINRTGDASTKVLDDIAVYSQGLSKATGAPMKAISANAVQIISDTQRWGDTTAEEATRISATLAQLGQNYDSFTGVIDKFQEFGSAAETAGMVSQITGGQVQLDAQEMMMMASEDPERFLPELRRRFLSSGFDSEALKRMSEMEQRQLASTFSMNRENLVSLLDTRREFNEADLKAQQEKTAKSGATAEQALVSNMELAAKANNDLTDAMDHHRTKALLANKQALLETAEAYSDYNDILRNVDFKDAEKVSTGYSAIINAQKDGIEKLIKLTPRHIGSLLELGNIISSEANNTASNVFNNQSPQINPTNNTLQTGINSNTNSQIAVISNENQTQFQNISEKVSTLSSQNEAALNNSDDIENMFANTNKSMNQLTTSVQNLVKASNQTIILNIDGKQLGKLLIDNKYTIDGAPVQIVTTAGWYNEH